MELQNYNNFFPRAGVALTTGFLNLRLIRNDYTLQAQMTNFGVEPWVAIKRSFYTSYPQLALSLNLGVRGHFSPFSYSHVEVLGQWNDIELQTEGDQLLAFQFYGAGGFAEWGISHSLGQLRAIGLFVSGACLMGEASIRGNDTINLPESLPESIDTENLEMLSEDRNFFLVDPQLGGGLLFRDRKVTVQLSADTSFYPTLLFKGIYLTKRSVRVVFGFDF